MDTVRHGTDLSITSVAQHAKQAQTLGSICEKAHNSLNISQNFSIKSALESYKPQEYIGTIFELLI